MRRWLDEIEQELHRLLPPQVDNGWVKQIFQVTVPFEDDRLFETICEPGRDLLYRGGKRWRPMLLLLNAKMLGGTEAYRRAKELVGLVELPHNGSLIIDDIEDASVLRRGKPAAHVTYGTDISINAGNLLYFLPTITIDNSDLPDSQKLRLYTIYSEYMRKIHLGQGMDIAWHHTIDLIPSVEAYELMCRMKTGCLAAMGAQIGAAIATEDEQVVARAGLIAEHIGLSFQMFDDVINLEKGNPGKHRGDDIVENKKSLPIILYAQSRTANLERMFEVFRHAHEHGYEASKDRIRSLIDEIERSGALAQARDRALALARQVIDDIEELYEPSEDREVLTGMVKGFIEA